MLSGARRAVVSSVLLLMLLHVSACAASGGYPPVADLQAVTEAKPVPSDAIASDPTAEALYNASVESWGDRLSSAGGRLCRFFRRTGMPDLTFCPER